MKILIAEDNELMRSLIRNVVKDLGTVLETSDASEAVAVYEEHQPDWVLMDIRMGTTNGIAATRQIKTAFPEARIVIVTNYDDGDLREAARSAGACEYVLKEDLLSLRRIIIHLPKTD